MCGIAGLISKKNQTPPRSDIEKMMEAQKHRGPDGNGVFEGPGFVFGHNRLAILDLSDAGCQPMELTEPNGRRLVLTYNGEIYNYLELRAELETKGHHFHSGTDTEVLLHAYQEWGEACLSRFNGMFAFVLYDSAHDYLFGARDRFGVKPLHLRQKGSIFSFASEIKALLAVAPADGVDRQMVVDYLYSGHLNYSGRTFFSGIEELKPGHSFIYDLRSHRLTAKPWYVLRDRVKSLVMKEDEAKHELRRLLEDSVRLRLRSDVRVGTCLSGGIDSSSIASLASKFYSGAGSFIGITAESLDPENNETRYAEAVAKDAKLEWHKVKPLDFQERLREVVHTQDEPFGGLSVFMQDAVMREARRLGVPVLLDGQGGDEVFLGYPKYLQAKAWPPAKLLAKRIASGLGFLEPRELAKDLSATASLEVAKARAHLLSYRRALSDAREAQILDITQTNLPQLLRYEDRNSMRHSIETRLPFLDYRLVEFGLGLPMATKIQGDRQKAVLRDAMRDAVPAAILDRRDKIGFAAPDRSWEPAFRALWCDHVVSSAFVREFVPDVDRYTHAGLSSSSRWKLINLAIWAETYFI